MHPIRRIQQLISVFCQLLKPEEMWGTDTQKLNENLKTSLN